MNTKKKKIRRRKRRSKILTRALRGKRRSEKRRRTKPKKGARRKVRTRKPMAKKAVGKRKVAKTVKKRVRKPIVKRHRVKKLVKRRKERSKRKQKPRAPKRPKVTAQKPVYALNTGFEFFYELRDLVLKSSPAEKDKMVERLNKLGRVKLAIISGIFINKENLDPLITDLFIVGDDIDRRKLRSFLKATEAEVGKEIKFTVMDKDEFQYRLAMFDRFIRVLLESPHEKLINKLGL